MFCMQNQRGQGICNINNKIKIKAIREDVKNIGEGQQCNESHDKIDMILLYYILFENITMELIAPYKYNTLIKL